MAIITFTSFSKYFYFPFKKQCQSMGHLGNIENDSFGLLWHWYNLQCLYWQILQLFQKMVYVWESGMPSLLTGYCRRTTLMFPLTGSVPTCGSKLEHRHILWPNKIISCWSVAPEVSEYKWFLREQKQMKKILKLEWENILLNFHWS